MIAILEQVSITASLLLLFLTLQCYKYEIMYRTLVAIIAFLGLLWPPVYLIPYGLILWRVFVGANVVTENKMYIGRRKYATTESYDPSNASTHWVVVIERGEQDYIYTHAVGEVILGKGERRPFEKIDCIKLNSRYDLTHVGYVTRKNTRQKMVEVVELEPMKSGNSCQEFAVDIAFQLSGSRTFTFMKTMTMFRIRTVIFYTFLCVSVIAYLAKLHWLANIVNAVVICNVFVSIELSRIGIHNTGVQQGYMPVIRAYLNYPKPRNFFQLFLTSIVVLVLYYRLGLMESALIGFVILIIISIQS